MSRASAIAAFISRSTAVLSFERTASRPKAKCPRMASSFEIASACARALSAPPPIMAGAIE